MNRLKGILTSKSFIICVSLFLVYTLSGFFLIPYLMRHYVPEIVKDKTAKTAGIGDVRFNPYIFTLEVNDFTIDEPDDRPILGFKRLFIDFELKSLFKWAWTFNQVAVEKPLVNAIIASDGALNLAQLAPASGEPPVDVEKAPDQDKGEEPPRLFIKYLSIDKGRIHLVDERQSKPAVINLEPLDLHVENLNTFPEEEGQKTITLTTGEGGTFRWAGDFSLNPVATNGTVVFEHIKTSTLWKFFRDSVNLDMPEGYLNVAADCDIDLGDVEPQVVLSNLRMTLTGTTLKLAGDEEPFLELPSAGISEARIDLFKQRIDVGNMKLDGGRVVLIADESGVFNLERIIKIADAQHSGAKAIPVSEKDAPEPWNINLAAFELNGFKLDYRDMSREPGLTADIGDVEVDFKVEIQAGIPQTTVLVSDLAIVLSKIAAFLLDTPKPAVRIDEFKLQGGAYDLAENHFTAEKVSINGGGVDFQREADGSLNLALVARPQEREKVIEKPEETPDTESPFRFMINTVAISGLDAAFSDFSIKKDNPIVNLEDFALVLNTVDGKSPMTFDAGLKVRQGGRIKAAGTINPSVPSAQSDVRVEDLELKTFQPYIEQAAYLVLQSGMLSTQGTLQYGIGEAGSQTAFEGGFRVDNLRLTEPGGTETFLGWKDLRTDNLQLRLDPNRLEIGQLDVAEMVGKFIIYEDQTINIVKVMKTDADAEPESSTPSKSTDQASDVFPLQVRRINLSDGKVEFADLSLTPQFGTKIHELKGTILGVGTENDSLAEINLDGRVDDYGTAKVEGALNTSDPGAFTDIRLTFRNVEMTKLTPYAGKFAGRKIDSGRLSLDLKYQIEKSLLAGDNQIVVEHLVLGKRVESPEATDLPLDLAIALMEDSDGVIDIGLPVKGSLDSPEFSFGGLIWKALTNLLTKIATSPFRALASLIPGGEDETLNMIAFEPGRSSVSPPEKEKLMKMTLALKKRPRLRLVVQGRYNPETDLDALRSARLRRSLAVGLGQKPEPGEDPGPVDYGNPETVSALEEMFKKRFGLDALNRLKEKLKGKQEKEGEDADAPPESKDKKGNQFAKMLFDRLKDVEPVGDRELLQLAEDRSRAVADELSIPDGISRERIDIKSPAVDNKDQPTAMLDLEPVK
ncbi:MAG: DUF748 domain-containing protein [Deltaproteobacteria bacterium]|nr:DUF748 domain-containing protein [Deltaproteobacteria bacterium]